MTRARPLRAVIDRIPKGGGLEGPMITQLRPMNLLEWLWYAFTHMWEKETPSLPTLTDEELRTVEYTVEISPKLFRRMFNSYKLSDPVTAGFRINLILTPSDDLKLSAYKAAAAGGLV